MRLGYIDYLNCYPFYYTLFNNDFSKEIVPNLKIIADYPSKLNNMVKENKLDLSPISSASYPGMYDDVVILPDFCLASLGYVRSVILISKYPIEYLDKKNVGLTIASNTSVILLKILLKKYYNIEPIYSNYIENPGLKDFDAALVIGNDALMHYKDAIPYTYDIGDLWLRKTSFPVVFAVFAVQKKYLEKNLEKVNFIISEFKKSFNLCKDNKKEFSLEAEKKYPNISYDISDYYEMLKYEFTDNFKKALMFYYDISHEMGFLEKIESVNYYNEDK